MTVLPPLPPSLIPCPLWRPVNFGNYDNPLLSAEVLWPMAGKYESTTGGYHSGRRGGGEGCGSCMHKFWGRINYGSGSVWKRRAGCIQLTTTRPAHGPAYLGGWICFTLCLAPSLWWQLLSMRDTEDNGSDDAPPPPTCCGESDMILLRITVGKSILLYCTIYI